MKLPLVAETPLSRRLEIAYPRTGVAPALPGGGKGGGSLLSGRVRSRLDLFNGRYAKTNLTLREKRPFASGALVLYCVPE
jgi:hypothetical protein